MSKSLKEFKKKHIKKVQSHYNKLANERKNEIRKHVRGLKGKLMEWVFTCDLCGHKRTRGYLYKDGDKEYEICKFCNDRMLHKNNHVRILYTPMGNKR